MLIQLLHLVSWNWGQGHPSGEVAEVKEQGSLEIKSAKGNTIKKNATPDDPAVHVSRPGNDVVKRAHELTVLEEGPNHHHDAADKEGSAAPEKKRGKKGGSAAPEKRTKKEASAAPAEKRGKKEGSAAPETKRGKKEASAAPEKNGAKDTAAPAADKGAKKGANKRAASEVNGADDEEKDEPTAAPAAKKARGAAGAAAKKTAAAKKDEDKEMKDADASTKKTRGRPEKGESEAQKEMKTKAPKKAATETGEPRRSGRNKA